MSLPKQTFFRYIKEFKLKELFNDLGWDNIKLNYPVKVADQVHTLVGVAEKKGFVIFLYVAEGGQGIPDSTARKKIDNAIAKLHHEHLIIYLDGKKTRQHWELLIREQNKPVVSRPIDYYAGRIILHVRRRREAQHCGRTFKSDGKFREERRGCDQKVL